MTLTRLLCKIASVQGLSEHGLDDDLATDIQRRSLAIQLLQQGCGDIDVDALDGWPDCDTLSS